MRAPIPALTDLGGRVTALLGPLALLGLRLPVAYAFWASGRTRVEGWNILAINDKQAMLFEYEFGMPLPELTAHVTAIAEHVLPVMVVLGLATRLGALGLLVMALVIQLLVYPDAWITIHMYWVAIAFAVVALGPGPISLDHLIAGRPR